MKKAECEKMLVLLKRQKAGQTFSLYFNMFFKAFTLNLDWI